MANPFNKELRAALEEVLNVSDYDTETEKIAKKALANTTKADENWEAVKRLIKAVRSLEPILKQLKKEHNKLKAIRAMNAGLIIVLAELLKAYEALPAEVVVAVMEDKETK